MTKKQFMEMSTQESDFTCPFDNYKKLQDGERVVIQVCDNVRSLFVVNVKEISYKDNKWEVTMEPFDNNKHGDL